MVVPGTITDAPITACPAASDTVPLILRLPFWADNPMDTIRASETNMYFKCFISGYYLKLTIMRLTGSELSAFIVP